MNNKGSAKTVYLVIIAVISTACIIIGAGRHFGRNFKFSIFPFVNLDLGSHYSSSEDEGTTVTSEKFDRIRVDAAIADVRISSGNDYNVSCDYHAIEAPRVSVENGKLNIVQDGKAFAINMNPEVRFKIYITVPSDVKIEDIDIDDDLGNIDMVEIRAGKIRMNASLGNVDVKSVESDFIDIDASMGNVDFTDTYADEVKVNNSMGEIRIKGFFNSITADCSMGDIKVDNENESVDVKVNLDTSMGDIKYNGNKKGTHFDR